MLLGISDPFGCQKLETYIKYKEFHKDILYV
jgi:hypothetical protein